MLISCNRLKKYIKNSEDIDFEKVWQTFTMKTAEVENVTLKGYDNKDVVTAKIVECKPHPESKKLSLLKVSDGEKEYDIVCGAPNVRVGLIGALVRVGGMVSGMEIKERRLAGYLSCGMMCAWDELGIGDDHSGILELNEDTPLGVELSDLYPIKDIIVEIDNKSLTNRPDLWGHYGIAREICAITNHELNELPILEVENNLEDLDIKIEEPKLCRRYCGIKVKNLKNNQTPIDMQIFLNYVGMRSINLFVDLTNFLMLELGQPMHAFDERVVKNIQVRLAKENDTYKTLDQTERTLKKDTLMITNGQNYFGIAGVMGGLDSEILDDTDSIFIESANFNAGSIRKTAIALGLRTEASARYEKSLDPNMCDLAIKRLLYLLKKENPNMTLASNLTDIYPEPIVEKEVILKKETIKRYTNISFSDTIVKNILEPLGFKVSVKSDAYHITVPTYRATKDISLDADIIEELVRIYGFDKLKEEPLQGTITPNVFENIWDNEYHVKRYLANAFNLHEIHSYIWYETDLLNKLGIIKENVKLLSSSKNNILRDDLSLSLLPIVKNNLKNYPQVDIMEIGTIIKDNQNEKHLSIIKACDEDTIFKTYQEAKRIVITLFKVMKNIQVKFIKGTFPSYYDPNKSQKIMVGNKEVGELKIFSSKCNQYIGKKKIAVAIDINFMEYLNIKKQNKVIKEISKYPVVSLDYTISTNLNTLYEDIEKILHGFTNSYIKELSFIDVFTKGENKNYTIRYIVGSDSKTLTSEELEKFKNKFIKYIEKNDLKIVS